MKQDDPKCNVLFVQCVKHFECLYNYRLDDYNDRDAQDAAWNSVANQMQTTAEECKIKWKNLRGCLTRYLKHLRRRGTTRKTKPYYLYEAMKFVVPFTKSRPHNYNLKKVPLHSIKMEIQGTDKELDDCDLFSSPAHEFRLPLAENIKMNETDCLENSSMERGTKICCGSSNPDLDFFKSILPDIADFNRQQKRNFKQKVLQVIDDISNNKTS